MHKVSKCLTFTSLIQAPHLQLRPLRLKRTIWAGMCHVSYLAYKRLQDPTVILRLTSDLDMSSLQTESSSRSAACTPLSSVVSNVSSPHTSESPPSASTSSHTNDGCEVAVHAAWCWSVWWTHKCTKLSWLSKAYMRHTWGILKADMLIIANAKLSKRPSLIVSVHFISSWLWLVLCLASFSSGGSS